MSVRLSPLGAARLAFEGRGGTADPLPAPLLEAARAQELDEGVLYRAWELLRCAPALAPEERRAAAFLIVAALVALGGGSTRLPLAPELLFPRLRELGAHESDRAAVASLVARAVRGEGAAAAILGRPGRYLPLLVEGDVDAGGHLYLHRIHHHETALVDALSSRLRAEPFEVPREALRAALSEVLARPPAPRGRVVELSAEQQRAALAAVHLPLCVISGGPGTGKTSIVASILRLLVRLGVPPASIRLAAPTGKAANRMHESLAGYLGAIDGPGDADRVLREEMPEPATLHRLLGYLPARDAFRHHAANPVDAEVVIVDEASMIDLFLMQRLVRAVRPEARLVLLGDAEQLPSVDAGAVLRDLVPDGEAAARPWDALVEGAPPPARDDPDPRRRCAVRLTRSYRMDEGDPAGRNVLSIARAIRTGDPAALRPGSGAAETLAIRESAAALAFERTELLAGGADAREAFLARWWRDSIRGDDAFDRRIRHAYRWDGAAFAPEDEAELRALLAHFERFRILCVTRGEGQPAGAGAVNRRLHLRALEAARGEDAPGVPFLPGEPVMMQQNDYERGIFNGDQGLVLRVQEPGRPSHHFRAVFPRREGWGAFHLDGLRGRLALSYAMTVHKAQGSEFDRVALLLPERPMPLLSREILYTAVTRARRSVVLVGSPEVLEAGIRQRAERWSGVGERLLAHACGERSHIER